MRPIPVSPAALAAAALAVAGAASGATVLVLQQTTVCRVAVAPVPFLAPRDAGADAERAAHAANLRRALAHPGTAATGGLRFGTPAPGTPPSTPSGGPTVAPPAGLRPGSHY